MPVAPEVLQEIAVSMEEYERIVTLLRREPNPVELGMFGALWSEHCGYKNSRPLLRMFPNESPRVLVRAGEENAGAVDIGDGLAVVLKVESHNHPSAIEPYEGAATGVGGIVRDIFAMGAFPIALMNSLRFGPLTDPHNRHLFGGVVAGISGYGNCLGIPNVGGEIVFAESYAGNPLVNAMCVGLLEQGKLTRAQTGAPGNILMLVGSDTGRDGIHGASGLASTTDPSAKELRSAVQVGNPFMEKLLIEACMELAAAGFLVGMQDLGAAGLTSSAIECAARSGTGLELDVLAVPRRATGMTAYEVMLSESQERMLVIVKPEDEGRVRAVFDKYDLHCAVIGRVTDDGMARIKEGDSVVADVPVRYLTDPPQYRRQGVKPAGLDALQAYDFRALPDLAADTERRWRDLPSGHRRQLTAAEDLLLRLLASPNIASKAPVFRQYDHMVQDNTIIPPGHDAAVLRVKGTRRGLALTTDGNGRLCFLDPYIGGMIAVCEAARNVSCVGAEPIAATDCLNFGNPERLEIYYQLEECIRGMADACTMLGIPVVSGNVSLYNETGTSAVYPTPVIGMLGLLENVERRAPSGFTQPGSPVMLLGDTLRGESADDNRDPSALAGSEYAALAHGVVAGQPRFDIALEQRLQQVVREAIARGWVTAAHDGADGGLAVALAEMCMLGNVGLTAWSAAYEGRADGLLFGERQSRIVVEVAPEHLSEFAELAGDAVVPRVRLGVVGGDRLTIANLVDMPVSDLADAWRGGLERALNE
jgi:phosphoribosylformylglycinamidine synthase